jgi:hypothetical protein
MTDTTTASTLGSAKPTAPTGYPQSESLVGKPLTAVTSGPQTAYVEEITSTAQTVPTDLTTRTVKDISNPKREALSRAGHVLRPVLPNFRVSGMQKWEGRITEVNDATLTAELTPLLDEGVTVTGDIDLDLLSPEEDVQPATSCMSPSAP